METLDDESVDLIFCDLPYGITQCSWDCCIDLTKFWIEVMRIKKLNTPIFMTTTTKFGLSLLNSCPKKCPFRYDLIWVKSNPCGHLLARKLPLRKHEMIYVFYEKLPFYDLSSHKKEFIKDKNGEDKISKGRRGKCYQPPADGSVDAAKVSKYDPPLPVSVVKEESGGATGMTKDFTDNKNGNIYDCPDNQEFKGRNGKPRYEPPLPDSILEVRSTKGKHSTEKPVALMSWVLKYFSKEGDVVLDPTMGSGSTGVACKEMNRNFIGIEKDPEIYEYAVNRIEG
tara:strand:+ start:138 stop:986 length:849 start_codon:yes stop_codon:yes gene_type:complete